MWLVLALLSASFLGLYDVAKKVALKDNAVLVVLFVTTLISSLLFLPSIALSYFCPESLEGTTLYVREATLTEHLYLFVKAIIVLLAWLLGYVGMKYLPITLVGPINATRPVMVLVGASLIFNESLNLYQWIGVAFSLVSLYLLSRSGKKEGINFANNRWVLITLMAALFGAMSGLYDKFLLMRLDPMLVQSWYRVYQLFLMCPILYLMWGRKSNRTPFRWSWAMVLIPILVTLADIVYFSALEDPASLVSIVAMIRRGSVLVSFTVGAFLFGESNLKGKAIDLLLIFIGMLFLCYGSLV